MQCTEIWDALKAAAEADVGMAQLILDSAGITLGSSDMTTCYDERGEGNGPAAFLINLLSQVAESLVSDW